VDTALNETGIWQSDMFYNSYKNHPFDIVFTSALKRSQQSVKGFIAMGIPHIILPELNEISWGDFEGKPQSEQQKALYWNMIQLWNSGVLDAKIPNGESPLEMQGRQKKALQLMLETDAENILVCMHGRAMKSFLCLLLGVPLTQMEEFPHANLCLYQLEYDGFSFSLVRRNDIEHLNQPSV
jgi:probable phosphoglycerate mutase